MSSLRRICVVVFAASGLCSAAAGQVGYSIQSNGDDHLYEIDLSTGIATDMGQIAFGDSEGMTFGPGGFLYGIGGSVEELWNITTNTLIGPTGPRDGTDAGLDWAGTRMFNINGASGGSTLYAIDPNNGQATLLGSSAIFADNIAIHPAGRAFAIDAIFTDSLYAVDLTNGDMTLIGGLGVGNISMQMGSSFAQDRLYTLGSDGNIYTVDTNNGLMTLITNVKDPTGAPMSGWEGLAIIPSPTGAIVLLIGMCGFARGRQRREP